MSKIPLPTREDQFPGLIEFAKATPIEPNLVAELAQHLALSGDRLSWPAGPPVADLASTGGPGSLSTLIVPFELRARGLRVVKLGVPGRPAGAIDVMGTLPGYAVNLTPREVRSIVDACGYAHFLADERFAPLDASLFSFRVRTGAVAIPLLAAASLLAKKLAVGVQVVGLDVRVGAHGNFGTTLPAARENAKSFCAAAKLVGIEAIAFLSDAAPPAQPLIGRGEAILALAAAVGERPLDEPWLVEHLHDCSLMADAVANYAAEAQPVAAAISLVAAVELHLKSQGSDLNAFSNRAAQIGDAPTIAVAVKAAGRLVVDMGRVRDFVREAQDDRGTQKFPDCAGLRLLRRPSDEVRAGDTVALLRYENPRPLNNLGTVIDLAFRADPAQYAAASERATRFEVIYA